MQVKWTEQKFNDHLEYFANMCKYKKYSINEKTDKNHGVLQITSITGFYPIICIVHLILFFKLSLNQNKHNLVKFNNTYTSSIVII